MTKQLANSQQKEKTIYQDIIGRDLKVDDYVSAVNGHNMVVAKILKLTPKMVSLQKLNDRSKFNRYPQETTLLLPIEDVVFYVLKNHRV
jgi:hypothetical protein